MKESCYITSTRTTHKHRKKEIIGPCGPCTFINLIGLKGSFKLEKRLVELGRLKPFYASNISSFILWAKKYKKEIIIYTEDTKMSNGTFKMMFRYENIPKEKQKELKKQAIERYEKIIKENKSKINIIKEKPLKIIDKLLANEYSVAFNMADYFGHSFLTGHLRVCYKKDDKFYYIKDSKEGLMKLTKKEMQKGFSNLKKIGSKQEIIAYKP
ncbi:MAG: hypothetical protein WCI72_02460 [archaeon]